VKKAYAWRNGTRFGGSDPQAVGEAVAILGSPTAERLVDAAKAKGSPLHSLFEWDDSVAAGEHRLETARNVMRSLVITVVIEEVADPVEIRAFEAVTVESGEAKAYVPTMKVMGNDEWREEVIGRLRGDLVSAKRQLEAYAYLNNQIVKAGAHVVKAIGALEKAA
jgi:hypothetical protein